MLNILRVGILQHLMRVATQERLGALALNRNFLFIAPFNATDKGHLNT